MDEISTPKIIFHRVLLMLSGLPIMLILVGILIELGKFISYKIRPVYSGAVDVTIEHLVFMGGLYLSLPCGLIILFTALSARSKKITGKWLSVFTIILAVFGILFGILALIYYSMVSAFEF